MKEKEKYERPLIEVVELRHQQQLLAGSTVTADSLNPFTDGGDPLGSSARSLDDAGDLLDDDIITDL